MRSIMLYDRIVMDHVEREDKARARVFWICATINDCDNLAEQCRLLVEEMEEYMDMDTLQPLSDEMNTTCSKLTQSGLILGSHVVDVLFFRFGTAVVTL